MLELLNTRVNVSLAPAKIAPLPLVLRMVTLPFWPIAIPLVLVIRTCVEVSVPGRGITPSLVETFTELLTSSEAVVKFGFVL